MNDSANVTVKTSKLNSVLVKTVLVAALMTLSVVVTKSILNGQGKRELMLSAKSERISNVTDLLASQSGGAIKFGNEVAVSSMMKDVLASAEPDMLGSLVVNLAGAVLHETEGSN